MGNLFYNCRIPQVRYLMSRSHIDCKNISQGSNLLCINGKKFWESADSEDSFIAYLYVYLL